MAKVIDLCLSLPFTENQILEMFKSWILGEGDRGVANYRYLTGEEMANAIGTSLKELDNVAKERSYNEFEDFVREKAKSFVIPLDRFVKDLDKAGVEWGVVAVESRDNDKTARIVAKYPHKFVGQAYINPHDTLNSVKELERAVKELGLTSLYVSSYRYRIPPNDTKFYPLYAKAAELNIPVFIYTHVNFSTTLPHDIAHPRYIDEIARNFPKLRIVAALGGWPWVPELIGIAFRHQNVYIDTEWHPPKEFTIPNSGWEMLLQYGNTILQDRVCFASKWNNHSAPIKDVIADMQNLPLKDAVLEKWLYKNAVNLFNRG
jgi:predicted TIM-barrel fold metal-dependent hydrolase